MNADKHFFRIYPSFLDNNPDKKFENNFQIVEVQPQGVA